MTYLVPYKCHPVCLSTCHAVNKICSNSCITIRLDTIRQHISNGEQIQVSTIQMTCRVHHGAERWPSGQHCSLVRWGPRFTSGHHLHGLYLLSQCLHGFPHTLQKHTDILINWSSERHFIRADPSVVHCQQIQSNLYNNTGGWGLENAIHLQQKTNMLQILFHPLTI